MQPTQTEKVFPDGIMFSKPREGAPDFIKGALSVKKAEFIAYLQTLDATDEWANFDLKKSKGGKLYLDLNDWKPESKETPVAPAPVPQIDIDADDVF